MPRAAEDRAAGRKIGTGNDLDQVFEADVRAIHQRQHAVDRLAEIVRRNIGRHADRDAAGAIDEKIGKLRRQDDRLELLLVVIGAEIDGVLVEILEQSPSRPFRAALRCSAAAAGGSPSTEPKLPCPSSKRQPHREILRHAHQRVVDREIAVRMVFAHRLADDARRFVVGPVGREIVLAHREQNAPMHRLQPVAHVGQCAADDHAHRVIEIAALHFVGDRNGLDVGGAAAGRPLILVVSQVRRILGREYSSVFLDDFARRRHLSEAINMQ